MRPSEAVLDGTLYRVLLTYFLEEHRDNVLKLGTNPQAFELRTEQNATNATFNLLADSYMDGMREELSKLPFEHEIFVARSVSMDEPADYDPLDGQLFQKTMAFLNLQYKKAFDNCRRSGNHNEFANYCKTTPWNLLYHHLLEETGDTSLKNFVTVELPEEAKRTSLGGSAKENATKRKRGSHAKKSPTRDEASTEIMKRFVDLQEECNIMSSNQQEIVEYEKCVNMYHAFCDTLRKLKKNDDYDSEDIEAKDCKRNIKTIRKRMLIAEKKIEKSSNKPGEVLLSQDSDDTSELSISQGAGSNSQGEARSKKSRTSMDISK